VVIGFLSFFFNGGDPWKLQCILVLPLLGWMSLGNSLTLKPPSSSVIGMVVIIPISWNHALFHQLWDVYFFTFYHLWSQEDLEVLPAVTQPTQQPRCRNLACLFGPSFQQSYTHWAVCKLVIIPKCPRKFCLRSRWFWCLYWNWGQRRRACM
jgi:hypothetical protein